MTWNYRVCKETYGNGTQNVEIGYSIREAYYNKNGGIWAVTERAKSPYGESIEEIKQCLELMRLALNKEVIDLDTFVFENNN